MTAKGWDIDTTRQALGISYEHVRKIVRGSTIPSPELRAQLAKALDIDLAQLDRLALQQKRFKLPDSLERKEDLRLQHLTRAWDELSNAHRNDLLAIAKMWAKKDRDTRMEEPDMR